MEQAQAEAERHIAGGTNHQDSSGVSEENTEVNYTDLTYLTSVCTPQDVINKRLKTYEGCNVVNLSKLDIDPDTLKTLSFGLSFCPTPAKANKATVIEQVEKFLRTIKLRGFFDKHGKANSASQSNSQLSNSLLDSSLANIEIEPDHRDTLDSLFKFPSNWIPDVVDPTILLYARIVRKELLNSKERRTFPSQNISIEKLNKIIDLGKNPEIVIKKADKGNSIVILDTVYYLREGLRQLSDESFYRHLDYDLTPVHEQEVNRIVQSLYSAKMISKRLKKYLWAEHCRTAVFYMLPKIHKKNIPGRPIVSASSCATEKLSEFIDVLLNPLVTKTSSYVRDTSDFINKISDIDLENKPTIIASLDVCSLYTQIPQLLGLKCIAKVLRGNRDLPLPAYKILEILKVVLNCNNFTFNGEHFLQIQGVSMGTKCAPTYANLVLSVIETEFLSNLDLKPLLWLRFIDDIFVVYQHGLPNLQAMLEKFNSSHETLKLTLEWSYSHVPFLDTVVYIEDNALRTKLYRKPTDATNYLMYNSAHPPGCKKGFKSQAMRVRRNCSDTADYDRFIQPLQTAYKERGYPNSELTHTVENIRNVDRKDLLSTKDKPEKTNKIICTIPYNIRDIPARKIVQKYWHILAESPEVGHIFTSLPTFGYFRPKNFKEICCKAKVTYPPVTDTDKNNALALFSDTCDTVNCKNCKLLNKRKHFTSTNTHEKFRKKFTEDCETRNVVYMITCSKCHSQYIGETKRTAVIRWKEHGRDVKNKKDTPIATHFNMPDHKFWESTFEIIDVIKGNPDTKSTETFRLARETHWIITLQTLAPLGINGRLGRPISS